MERLNEGIERRTRVQDLFPNEAEPFRNREMILRRCGALYRGASLTGDEPGGQGFVQAIAVGIPTYLIDSE